MSGEPNGAGERAVLSAPQRLDANIITAEVDGGRIAENIVHFARLLRAAGLPVGPQKTILATEAVLVTGLEDPKILYWTLHAVFVNRRSEHDVFNQAYVMFWKDPGYIQQMLSLILPQLKTERDLSDKALSRRVSESLFKSADRPAPAEDDQIEIDAVGTFSATEELRGKDFEEMTADEWRRARRTIASLKLPFEEIRTRRQTPAPKGRIDLRRTLRNAGIKGADCLRPEFKERQRRRPPIVVLVDISGSMDSYARVFLHFVYQLINDRDRVTAFLFGTQLSHVTRTLKRRDPDAALAAVGKGVTDWSGGTRIGAALEAFNRRWARRVLGQNALVLLFTDGLDRDDGAGLERAARRLRANCRRLIWLNPLMRYDAYEPLAAGAQALALHASERRSCHNLRSLEGLAAALSADRQRER